MPVAPPTAYSLLRSFGLLEFELKCIPSFTGTGPRQSARVNWVAVDETVDQLPAADFLHQVSAQTSAKLLGGARIKGVRAIDVLGSKDQRGQSH